MAGIKIPGTAGIVEAKKALMAAAVQHQWNVYTATPQATQRRAGAGDLGRLQTVRLA